MFNKIDLRRRKPQKDNIEKDSFRSLKWKVKEIKRPMSKQHVESSKGIKLDGMN